MKNILKMTGCIILALSGLLFDSASAQITRDNPRLSMPDSRLDRSFKAPVFVTGHLGFGGSFQFDHGKLNYGGSFIFRPDSAVHFFDFLQKLRSAMVLRLDYQDLGPEARILSGDVIFRRYLAKRNDKRPEVLPFLGLGIGASDVRVPAGAEGGNSRYWSGLIEAGQEWYFQPDFVVVARFQYRLFDYGLTTVSTWSVSGAVGIPAPW